MKTKRTLSLFLALSMAVSLTVPAMAAEGGYVPGTYTATENGFAGPVTVTVTVDDSTITAITADGNETQGIGSRALEELPQTMLAAQSADVDTVKAIFQARIDYMVRDGEGPGGAWYPGPTEQWTNNSRVVSNGNYVMMVVHENCDDIVAAFNALF